MMKADLPYYLTSFLGKYLPGEKNASSHTIQSYSFTFKLLLTFFESMKSIATERLSMSDLTRDTIIEFLDWLESARSCGITTRNQRLVAIHSFVRFVQKQAPENLYEFQRILNIPDKKCAKTVVPFLTGDEMRILLAMPDPSNKNGLRDLVLLALLYDSAARVQEIIDLTVKDLRLDKPAVITLHGKGQKTRHVPITEKTKSLLQSYLQRNTYNMGISTGEEYVFVNQKKQQLSRWGISYVIGKYVDMAKLHDGFDVRFPVTALIPQNAVSRLIVTNPHIQPFLHKNGGIIFTGLTHITA